MLFYSCCGCKLQYGVAPHSESKYKILSLQNLCGCLKHGISASINNVSITISTFRIVCTRWAKKPDCLLKFVTPIYADTE